MEHVTQIRVRFGETDKMGVVYHAHFLVYFEQGRTEYMRAKGLAYSECERRGYRLVVVETGCRYRGNARYDEVVTIRTRVRELSGASMRFEYRLEVEGRPIAEGFTLLASIDAAGKPVRLPQELRQILRPD
jgi:acyl-CoA thioester hydrolase